MKPCMVKCQNSGRERGAVSIVFAREAPSPAAALGWMWTVELGGRGRYLRALESLPQQEGSGWVVPQD